MTTSTIPEPDRADTAPHPAPSDDPSTRSSGTATTASPRLDVLDVVRGVALSGILFANVSALLGVIVPRGEEGPRLVTVLEQLLVGQRFFPIFSLLFGIGFGMLWGSAVRRAARPRWVLARRLLALGLLGALHHVLQPGEALLPYAVVGLLVLLPVTVLPDRARLMVTGIGGICLTVLAAPFGGVLLIPGLFLLGMAAAQLQLPARFEASARPGRLLALTMGVTSVPFLVLQILHPETAGFDAWSAVAGLLSGLFLVGLLALLLHTPLRRALVAFFSPLGRMALSTYVATSVIIVLAGLPFAAPLAGLRGVETMLVTPGQMVAIWGGCVVLLILQSLAARWWLRRFGQGPLERLWRWASWAGTRAS